MYYNDNIAEWFLYKVLCRTHTTGNKTFSNEDFLMQEVSNTRTVPKSAKIIDKEFWNVRRPLTHLHLTVLIKVGLNASFNHL